MRVIKNINSVNVCTLGNKGVNMVCAALDALMKKDRKNIANYLVVPNNFVLSLSLSQGRRNLLTFFFSHTRERRAVQPL